MVENLVAQPLAQDFNVAPTKEVYAVLERPDRVDGDGAAVPGARQLRTLRWGLVPSWAKNVTIGSRMINARLETADSKPAFRKAFRARRCVVPADGYYEWYSSQARDAKGRAVKQPYFIRPVDGSVLAMAGLYEIWRDPAADQDDPHPFLWTCTLLTTSATDELGHIHDRMPLMVTPERLDDWLDPVHDDPETVRQLLTPAAPGALAAYPVSRAVSNVRNNGAHLIDPIPLEEVGASGADEQLALLPEA